MFTRIQLENILVVYAQNKKQNKTILLIFTCRDVNADIFFTIY